MTDDRAPHGAVTQWLLDWGRSDKQGLDQMLPVVYQELHQLATLYLSREGAGHTLQPTALVNEAYLRLVDQRRVDWRNRAQFLGMAANMMRRILVNHARDRAAQKRGGNAQQISLSLLESPSGQPDVDLIALEDALSWSSSSSAD
jgi:RNA polymerase sigma factor (TIGR02999 family)